MVPGHSPRLGCGSQDLEHQAVCTAVHPPGSSVGQTEARLAQSRTHWLPEPMGVWALLAPYVPQLLLFFFLNYLFGSIIYI